MKAPIPHIIHAYLNREVDLVEVKNQLSKKDFEYWKDTLQLAEEFPISNFDKEAAYQELLQKRDQKRTKAVPIFPLLKIAAAIVLLAISTVFTVLYLNTDASPTQISYNAENTENTLTLPDESQVWLNTNARITYHDNNWEINRNLSLQGEAYFKVKKGSKFTVETALGNVQVLGTSFTVAASENQLEVTCYTGKVSVTYDGEEIILNPKQRFTSQDKNISKVQQLAPSWIGQSLFEAASLTTVIQDVERVKNIKISLQLNQELSFTGGYSHRMETEEILQLISQSLGISYKKMDATHYVLINQED